MDGGLLAYAFARSGSLRDQFFLFSARQLMTYGKKDSILNCADARRSLNIRRCRSLSRVYRPKASVASLYSRAHTEATAKATDWASENPSSTVARDRCAHSTCARIALSAAAFRSDEDCATCGLAHDAQKVAHRVISKNLHVCIILPCRVVLVREVVDFNIFVRKLFHVYSGCISGLSRLSRLEAFFMEVSHVYMRRS